MDKEIGAWLRQQQDGGIARPIVQKDWAAFDAANKKPTTKKPKTTITKKPKTTKPKKPKKPKTTKKPKVTVSPVTGPSSKPS